MVDSLYYSSRKIPERCENSFVDYRINYQKLCYLMRQITKDLNSASVCKNVVWRISSRVSGEDCESAVCMNCEFGLGVTFFSFHFILFRKSSKDKKHRKEYIKVHLFPLWSLRWAYMKNVENTKIALNKIYKILLSNKHTINVYTGEHQKYIKNIKNK